jgi:DNA mismatch repair protein MutS
MAYGRIVEDISGSDLGFKDQYYPTHVDDSPIANDFSLEKNAVITGPNASGKTTFIKTTMINIIVTQQLGCGFYKDCALVPYTHIHSYLNIPDTSCRDSLFQAESRRCKEILDVIHSVAAAESRHFCIFDELYSGTNPIEATKSAYAFLTYLSKYRNVDFMLTTHYTELCERLEQQGNSHTANYQMSVDEDADTNSLTYLYKIEPGISTIQGAIKILIEMDYPAEIIRSVKDYDLDTQVIDTQVIDTQVIDTQVIDTQVITSKDTNDEVVLIEDILIADPS